MSIVSCPRCGDKVSVPPAASPSALVQCPLCLEEYFLSDALIQLPPMLIVRGAAPAAEKEGDYRLAEPVAAAVSAAEFDVDGGTAVAARPQLRTVSRRRPQERGMLGEIVKIVLGGVAGLAGGLMVLWWGFGVDVGDLAPKVSRVQYLRFLVPPKLRAQTVTPDPKSSQLDTMNAEAGDGKRGRNQPQDEWTSADDENSRRPATENQTQGKPAKGKKPAKEPAEDPFAALDFPGTATPATEATELKIDDPLSAIKPPKEEKPKKNKEPPAAEPDEAKTKDQAEDSDSKETKGDKPAAEKPKERPKSDERKPDEPKSDEPKPDEKDPE